MIKLSVNFNSRVSDVRFEQVIQVKEKLVVAFPHIEFEFRQENPTSEHVQMWIASNNVPDILVIDSMRSRSLAKEGLLQNLDVLVNRHGTDLSRFEPGCLSTSLAQGDGVLYVFPYERQAFPLFYNKDIFDWFGMPYPRDGMTWDEVIELAQRVTGVVDGSAYQGLNTADTLAILKSQLSENTVAPHTDNANVMTDGWRKIADVFKRIYSIPGNMPVDPRNMFRFNGHFGRDKVVAMGIICAKCLEDTFNSFNWDMVSLPVFSDAPGIGPNFPWISESIAMSSTCRESDAAFEVMSYLVSDEFQLHKSRNGFVSCLKDREMYRQFAQNISVYEHKNTEALAVNTLAEPILERSKYETLPAVTNCVVNAFVEMVQKDKDIELVLEELQQNINKIIESEKANAVASL
ncbi:ABC transporter substrate-binding protein [Alicyclobacillus fodiniaquatilis]|uniref:ABC transporter substrate-binding protein n=1 Tax=Alicyclobacillus fodiniaquatilis TaxID=1661150 RepID=A0ABW4JLD0_9BACL